MLSGRRLSALDRDLNRQQIGDAVKSAAGSAAQAFVETARSVTKSGTKRLQRSLSGSHARLSQSEGRPSNDEDGDEEDARSSRSSSHGREFQSKAFRRMVIVLKFLRVVIDAIELQQFKPGSERDQFARFRRPMEETASLEESKWRGDNFEWGPLTLSSITPVAIVDGRAADTLQLMRTIVVFFTPFMWCHDGAFGLGGYVQFEFLVYLSYHEISC